MGHDNIAKLAGILMKLHKKSPSGWLCLHPRPDQQRRTIKLVRSDGSSQIYDRPVAVSDLTKDFPKHKICRSDTLYIGQKTQSLSESETLKLGLNYFLLPSDFFLNDLSFLSIASLKPPNQNGAVLVKKKHVRTNQHNSNNNNNHQPFLIQKGGTGERLRIRVSEDFLSELIMEGRNNREIEKTEEEEDDDEEEEEGRVCTTVKLKKDYVQLVGLRKWKPKLETITETKAMKEKKKKKEKEKEKRKKKFTVMKKRSCKESSSSSQIDSCAKRKLKSKTNKSVLS